MHNLTFLIFALLVTASCADGKGADYLTMKRVGVPTDTTIHHCRDYGCFRQYEVTIPVKTQKQLAALFKSKPKSAAQERAKINKAIQIFEKDIGAITYTDNDKGGTFLVYNDKTATGTQLDCIDESTNTTSYLTFLQNQGYLHFHDTVFPVTKQPFLNGARWWHQSAAIVEIATGDKYSVDSWFRDNGEPAYILPYDVWKQGRKASWDDQ